MKKSTKITLTVLAAVGMASCGRSRPDPCQAATFDDWACQDAVRNGGYYHRGAWIPMIYSHPYPYYYGSYSSYVARGGRVTPAPSGTYARPSGTSTSPGSSSGVSRGGFGSTGSGGHTAGA